MPRRTTAAESSEGGERKAGSKQRREQQRAKETRLAILKAALGEFADKGFDGTTVRGVADRAGLQHPLITYHFRNKEALWQSVAAHVWTTMAELWDANVPDDLQLSARDRVREEIKQLFRLTIMYPDFHHFMLRESRPNNPRLIWLAETYTRRMFERIVGHIRAAQEVGDMPPGDPRLVEYVMIGMVSALSSLSEEIKVLTGLDAMSVEVVDGYWALVERIMFPKPFGP